MREITITNVEELDEKQIESAYIDSDDLDNARLALSRALGQPEPVLYDDRIPLSDGDDNEKLLSELIELQERMARGMEMISLCNRVLDRTGKNRLEYDVYCSWVSRRKVLWAHWYKLKNECDKITSGNKLLWVEYYKLKDSTIDRIGYSEDVNMYSIEQYDDQVHLKLSSQDCVEQ